MLLLKIIQHPNLFVPFTLVLNGIDRDDVVESILDEKHHIWEHSIVQSLFGDIISVFINIAHVGDGLHSRFELLLPVSDYFI